MSRRIETQEEFQAILAVPGKIYHLYLVMLDGTVISWATAKEEKDRLLANLPPGGADPTPLSNTDPAWTPYSLEINKEDRHLFCGHSGERISACHADWV